MTKVDVSVSVLIQLYQYWHRILVALPVYHLSKGSFHPAYWISGYSAVSNTTWSLPNKYLISFLSTGQEGSRSFSYIGTDFTWHSNISGITHLLKISLFCCLFPFCTFLRRWALHCFIKAVSVLYWVLKICSVQHFISALLSLLQPVAAVLSLLSWKVKLYL